MRMAQGLGLQVIRDALLERVWRAKLSHIGTVRVLLNDVMRDVITPWSYSENCVSVVIADHTNRSTITCIDRIICVTGRRRLQQFDFKQKESGQRVELESRR
jgi:hypothetical protein